MRVTPKLFCLELHIRTIPQRQNLRPVLNGLIGQSDLKYCKRVWHEQPTPTFDPKWWSDTVVELASSGDPETWLMFFEDDVDQLNLHVLHNIENWSALDEPDFGLGWMIVPNGVLADKGKLGTTREGAIYRKWPALHNSALVLVQRKTMKRLTDDVANNIDVYKTCDYAGNWQAGGYLPLSSSDIGWTWGMSRLGLKTYIHAPGLATTDEINSASFLQPGVASGWSRRSDQRYEGTWRAKPRKPSKSFADVVAEACRNAETPDLPLHFALRLLAGRPAKCRTNILEFGAGSGGTIREIADTLRSAACLGNFRIVGFDSFTGLPEAWRPGFPVGAFSTSGVLPEVPPEVELVVGLFQDTLPAWVNSNGGPITLVHVDCDLYSSTACVMETIFHRTDKDTLWVFDELYNYDGFQCGEMAALAELCAKHDLVPEIVAAGGHWKQSAALYLRPKSDVA